jgi:sugar/nucleoside kinase (ribokinase family)
MSSESPKFVQSIRPTEVSFDNSQPLGPPAQFEAVDTTGAGDAFVGSFRAARLSSADIQPALERAVVAASKATTIIGDSQGGRTFIPTDRSNHFFR